MGPLVGARTQLRGAPGNGRCRREAVLSPLAARITDAIRRDGPLPLDRFWNLALFDREHGYYASQDPFGRGGDFVTAPEISQMFGELLGAWILAAWRALGSPSPFVFAEAGPGRGTLMADMLRTIRRLDPAFLKGAIVTLVETSDRLARLQAERLAGFDLPIRHRRRIDDVGDGPLLLVANELFDALAIRQFVAAGSGWTERCVDLAPAGHFVFTDVPIGTDRVPALPRLPAAGAILEVSPARDALAVRIGERIARFGGAALLVDYGHEGGMGDTLQAVRDHAFADPLLDPGFCDLTSHVDFASLRERFEAAGVIVAPLMSQGEFLVRLGLVERAAQLGADRSDAARAAIEGAARRLAGNEPGEMGALFKVLCAASAALPLPPFPLHALD